MKHLFHAAYIIFFGSMLQIVLAEEKKEPLLYAFKQHFQKEYFSPGIVMQFVFDYQNDRHFNGNNGFSVANARFQVKGVFDGGFGYFFQLNHINAPALLDAYMYFERKHLPRLTIGQFKVPFSKEFLIAAPNIDFVNRSRVVQNLVPGRQIGLMISGDVVEHLLRYEVGVFNGNHYKDNANDNQHFLSAGRIIFNPLQKRGSHQLTNLEVGFNAAFSEDKDLSLISKSITDFSGSRLCIGTDLRWTSGDFLLAGEYLHVQLKNDEDVTFSPSGFHFTLGYDLVPGDIQILSRWDHFDYEKINSAGKNDWLILGLNVWPTGVTEMQINYVVDLEKSSVKNHQILFNSQIAL